MEGAAHGSGPKPFERGGGEGGGGGKDNEEGGGDEEEREGRITKRDEE